MSHQGGPSELTTLTSPVLHAIEQVLPSQDPLDQVDFEVVSHINSLFPTEQSLTGLADTIHSVEAEISRIDTDIRSFVRDQTGRASFDGILTLNRAKASIETLVAKILDMKGRAEQSEASVRDMTRDIRQLDSAKRNLTAAITTLNHLNMVVGGVDKLKVLIAKKQYGDVANLLEGVGKVIEHFQNYKNIPQLHKLSDEVSEIKGILGDQLTLEFRESFSTGSLNVRQISETCLVFDVLEPSIKRDILQWFISIQLKEYTVLFDENEDVAWLDKVDKRYVWLKRHLIQFEERYGSIFPVSWDVSKRIAIQFCHQTRKDLAKVMDKRRHEIDVKLLLSAIQKTSSFENLLSLRFSGTPNPNAETSFRSLNSEDEFGISANHEMNETAAVEPIADGRSGNVFARIITQCFDPFLYIYIDSQDKNLVELLDKFVSELRLNGFPTPHAPDSSGVVLSNCADLFVFYKKCLVQCTQLSCGEPLLNLGHVFSKRLRDYCTRILQSNLPRIGNSSTSFTSVSALTRELRDFNTSGIIQNFQSFLKEGETVRFSRYELFRIACVLTTAEYCIETTQQLEEKLKQKMQTTGTNFSMDAEKKLFADVIDASVGLLVQDLYSACEPALITITKTNWQNIEAVGDQSGFISAITSQWKVTIPTLREFLATSRKYFVLLCQQFAKLFMTKFVNSLYKCRNISKMGAQQLLLDTQSLKAALLDLPSMGLTVKRKPPDKYSKIIVNELGRTEMILKVVMTPVEQVSSFVEHTSKLVSDCSSDDLAKILDMKGYKRTDQLQFIEEFKLRAPAAMSPPRNGADNLESSAESSRIKKLEKLLKKRT